MKLEKRLRKLPRFDHFSDSELATLAGAAQERTFGEGDTILQDGAPGNELFFILEGEAEIVSKNGDRRVRVGVDHPGDVFGLIGVLRTHRRTASVEALSPVRVAVLNRYAFNILYGESTAFCLLVTRQLVNDARRVSEALAATVHAEDADLARTTDELEITLSDLELTS